MVSFTCDSCMDVVKKPKLDQHHNTRCGASFTCLDCSKTFYSPQEWKGHTSCISEAQKYERTVWQGDKKKGGKQQQQQQQQQAKPAQSSNGAVASTSNGAAAGVNGSEEQAEASSSSKRKHEEEQGAKDREAKKAKKAAEKEAKKAAKANVEAATTSTPASAPAAADATLKGRVAAMAQGQSASKPVTLLDLLEAQEGESKKLRKELLKGITVGKDGSLSWA